MARVVLLVYHGAGHINPLLKPARVLEAKHEVFFAGFAFFKEHVESQGFKFFPLHTVPFGLGFESWVNTIEKKTPVYWNALKDKWNDRLYRLRLAELQKLLDVLKPDYILIDVWQSTDFIALYPLAKERGIKIAFIHAMLSTVVEPDLPPINSLALPDDEEGVRRSRQQLMSRQRRTTWLQTLKFFGRSNVRLQEVRIRSNHIPSRYLPNKPSVFSPVFQLPHLLFVPERLDFPSTARSHHHYLGSMIDTARVETPDPEFSSVERRLKEKLSGGDTSLIYCSFGSVVHDNVGNIKAFLTKLVSVSKAQKYFLVVSINLKEVLAAFSSFTEDIYFLKRVPQLELLSKACVFISHGGLNSIKEAIHFRVPMLIYPVNPHTDNNGNSARVVYHGLGLRGDLIRETENEIDEKILRLLKDPGFRVNLQRMKEADDAYSPERFLEVVNNLPAVD